jgi:DNA-binding transcriptional LysR family regulator
VFFDVRRCEGIIEGVLSHVAELGFALGLTHHPGIAHEVVHTGEMVCVLPHQHPLAEQPIISASDLAGLPFIGLERGTRLGEAVRDGFARAGAPFQPTVEVRYCNTACVLAPVPASAQPWSIRSRRAKAAATGSLSGSPTTLAVANMLWSEAEPLSRGEGVPERSSPGKPSTGLKIGGGFLRKFAATAARSGKMPADGIERDRRETDGTAHRNTPSSSWI